MVMHYITMTDLKNLRLGSRFFHSAVSSLVIYHATLQNHTTETGADDGLVDFALQKKARFLEHVTVNVQKPNDSTFEFFSSYEAFLALRSLFKEWKSLRLVWKSRYPRTRGRDGVYVVMRQILLGTTALQTLHLDLQWIQGLLGDCFHVLSYCQIYAGLDFDDLRPQRDNCLQSSEGSRRR